MSFKELLKRVKSSRVFKEFISKNKKAFVFSAFFILLPDFSAEKQQIDFYVPDKKRAVTFFIEEKKEAEKKGVGEKKERGGKKEEGEKKERGEKNEAEKKEIDEIVNYKQEDFYPKNKLSELNVNIKIDIKEIEKIAKKEIEEQKLDISNINKIIAIIQKAKKIIKKEKQNKKEKNEEKENENEGERNEEKENGGERGNQIWNQIWNVTVLLNNFKILRIYVDCFTGQVLESKQENILNFMQFKK